MTLRHGLTKGERFETLEKRVEGLEKAVRVSQMLLQQVGGSIQPMARDLGELANLQREVQYRVLAMQSMLGIDLAQLNIKAQELEAKDYDEYSLKDDEEKGYVDASEVAADSVVVISSKAEAKPASSILRAKVQVAEIDSEQLRKDILGKKVGDVLPASIKDRKTGEMVDHMVTVLGIKALPAKLEIVPEVKG